MHAISSSLSYKYLLHDIKAWSVIQTKTEQSLFMEGSTATIAWSYKTKEYKKIKTYKKSV